MTSCRRLAAPKLGWRDHRQSDGLLGNQRKGPLAITANSGYLFNRGRHRQTMDKKPLSPKNDFVFHKIFGENMTALNGFLQAVLDLPPEEYQGLEVVNPYLEREYPDDKLGILDLKIYTSEKKVINVEIQIRHQPSVWKRLLFYNARLLVEQVKKGNPYQLINRVITIYIADHVLIKDSEAYHHCFRLYDKNMGISFPDSIEFNILEIPKASHADGTLLSNWMQFFRAREKEEFMAAAQTHPAINEAWGVIKVLSSDERARALAEAREKARMDYEDSYSGAYREGLLEGLLEGEQKGEQKGIQKGIQEGKQEGKQEVALNALRENMPAEAVARLTGLPLAEVEQLAVKLAK
jgi:predicted transposase/invertase (TIGR01784 family)